MSSIGSRGEAAKYAVLSMATNIPNMAQCVTGRRFAVEIAEEQLLQTLAQRLCHRDPVVECRVDEDLLAEGRLAAATRMAHEMTISARERVVSDISRARDYASTIRFRKSDDIDQYANAAASRDLAE